MFPRQLIVPDLEAASSGRSGRLEASEDRVLAALREPGSSPADFHDRTPAIRPSCCRPALQQRCHRGSGQSIEIVVFTKPRRFQKFLGHGGGHLIFAPSSNFLAGNCVVGQVKSFAPARGHYFSTGANRVPGARVRFAWKILI